MVISFASRKLNDCEWKYNVTEKELLSVIFACNKFCMYILGYPITVHSDHICISFLKWCKLSHGQLMRWILALQECNIQWEWHNMASHQAIGTTPYLLMHNKLPTRDITEMIEFPTDGMKETNIKKMYSKTERLN